MQSLGWYARRLKSMSPQEIWWRVQSKVTEAVDRVAAPSRKRLPAPESIAQVNGQVIPARSAVAGWHLSTPNGLEPFPPDWPAWKQRLVQKADQIRRNRLDLFDLTDHDLGPQIQWNYEYKARKATPTGFAPAIDYRDYRETGDCKFVWEPSRHQHLVVLGRAYRTTGDTAYAETALRHIESWLEQCPYGTGMNWRSPLELGIRMINWVWTLDLIEPAGLINRERAGLILAAVYRHLWDISRKYSRFSSANNHLIGEAAGVFIGACRFHNLRKASAWRRESRRILIEEIDKQTYADGCNREQAMGYHLFVLEFFLLAGLAARNSGEDFPAGYWQQIERMFEFLGAVYEGGDHLPMYGDADDGYVLNLGDHQREDKGLLAVGACLFKRADFKGWSRGYGERAFWMLGPESVQQFQNIALPPAAGLKSRAFSASGYYLLQDGGRDGQPRASVLFDCGELGFGSIAAHGHADALSFVLRINGKDIFVDPGTYDYFTYGPWRGYFRSTLAHNTLRVDGQDQSEMQGSFLWGRRAVAKLLTFEPSADGGKVSGEHDGFTRLTDPVIHRRTLELAGAKHQLSIQDELSGQGEHEVEFALHLGEECVVEPAGDNRFDIRCPECGPIQLTLDRALTVQVLHASEEPRMGWVSRGYHRKQPAYALLGRARWQGKLLLNSQVTWA